MSFHHVSPQSGAHHVPWVYLGISWYIWVFTDFLPFSMRDSDFALVQLIWCSLDLDQARLI